MEKRKDCMTCFYEFKSPVEEPCVSCKGYRSWTSQETFKEEDVVNNPKHYNVGIEPIEAIESWKLGYNLGNVIKYVARADHKGKRIEDLKKARWYLDREINKNESNI
jgi:hypothetical protein